MVIGITGGVGCGKSTVVELLEKEYGAKTMIADNLGHEVMKKGGEAYDEIVACFGKRVVGTDGELNREKLAAIIFAEDEKREQLNQIIHPHVIHVIKKKIKEWQKEPLVVLETALLYETNCDKLCDVVWGIDTEQEVRIQRLIQSRGYTREKAESIMKKQLSKEAFQNRCDEWIDNSGTTQQLRGRLKHLLLGTREKMWYNKE